MSNGGEHMRKYLDILNEQIEQPYDTDDIDQNSISSEIGHMGREHGEAGKKYKTPAKLFAKLYNESDPETIAYYVELYNKGLVKGRSNKNAASSIDDHEALQEKRAAQQQGRNYHE